MNKTFGALDAQMQAAFTDDLMTLMVSRNRSGDGTLVLPSESLAGSSVQSSTSG